MMVSAKGRTALAAFIRECLTVLGTETLVAAMQNGVRGSHGGARDCCGKKWPHWIGLLPVFRIS
jgi:hypothetical protein